MFGFQQPLPTLLLLFTIPLKAERNCAVRAGLLTFFTADTFGRRYVKKARILFAFKGFYNRNLHGAGFLTSAAAGTEGSVQSHSVQRDFIKKSVKGAERTKILAKGAVDKKRKNHYRRQYDRFPAEQKAEA